MTFPSCQVKRGMLCSYTLRVSLLYLALGSEICALHLGGSTTDLIKSQLYPLPFGGCLSGCLMSFYYCVLLG